MPEMAETPEKSDSTEQLVCLYPGCDKPALEPPNKTDNPKRQGPPPRYCELEEHNAASAHLERQRLEKEASGD
jgi:hypothetical protein